MELVFESDRATLRRRNGWLVAAAIGIGAGGAALAFGLAFGLGIAPLVALAPISIFGGIALFRADLARRERLGRVMASHLGLFFDGIRVASAARIRCASLLADGLEPPIVRLGTGRGSIELRLESKARVEELLEALGVSAPAARYELSSPLLADPRGSAGLTVAALALPVVFAVVGTTLHAHPLLFAVLLTAACAAAAGVVVAVTARARLDLHADAVELSWLWRRSTIEYGEIEGARLCAVRGPFGGESGRGLALLLRSGAAVHVRPAAQGARAAREIAERLHASLPADDATQGYRRFTP